MSEDAYIDVSEDLMNSIERMRVPEDDVTFNKLDKIGGGTIQTRC